MLYIDHLPGHTSSVHLTDRMRKRKQEASPLRKRLDLEMTRDPCCLSTGETGETKSPHPTYVPEAQETKWVLVSQRCWKGSMHFHRQLALPSRWAEGWRLNCKMGSPSPEHLFLDSMFIELQSWRAALVWPLGQRWGYLRRCWCVSPRVSGQRWAWRLKAISTWWFHQKEASPEQLNHAPCGNPGGEYMDIK